MSRPSIKTFQGFLAWLKTLSAEKIRSELKACSEALMDKDLVDALCGFYPNLPAFSWNNVQYPCVALELSKEQVESPHLVFVEPYGDSAQPECEPCMDYYTIRETAAKHPASLYDGYPYAAKQILKPEEGGLRIECYKARYSQMVATSDVLGLELAHAWIHRNKDLRVKGLEALPIRNHINQLQEGNPFSCRGLVAAIGIGTLICIKRDETGEYYCLTHKRSEEVGHYPGRLDIIPSGMLERDGEGHFSPSFKVSSQVMRELTEELFGKSRHKEDASCEEVGVPWYDKYEWVKMLRGLLKQGDASLKGVSVSLDLINLRPTLYNLLLLPCEEWYIEYAKDMCINFESDTTAGERAVRWISLGGSDDAFLRSEAIGWLKSNKICPGAAVGLKHGTALARRLIAGAEEADIGPLHLRSSTGGSAIYKYVHMAGVGDNEPQSRQIGVEESRCDLKPPDLLLDECAEKILVYGRNVIYDLGKAGVRGIVFALLYYRGRSIPFRLLRMLCGIEARSEDQYSRSIYAARAATRNLLGAKFVSTALPRRNASAAHHYKPSSSWSYKWITAASDPRDSWLLHHLKAGADWSAIRDGLIAP